MPCIPCARGALGIIAVEFAITAWFLRSRGGRLPAFASFVSRNVLHIYVAQWILLGVLSPFLFAVTNIAQDMLVASVVLALSCLGAWLRTDYVEHSLEKVQEAYTHVIRWECLSARKRWHPCKGPQRITRRCCQPWPGRA